MKIQGADRRLFFGDGAYEFRIEEEPIPEEVQWKMLCSDWRTLFNEYDKK